MRPDGPPANSGSDPHARGGASTQRGGVDLVARRAYRLRPVAIGVGGAALANRREPDPDDRRVTLVTLTPSGAELYARARGDHRAVVAERFLDRLDPADLDVIERTTAGFVR
jgi:hypothetical protein